MNFSTLDFSTPDLGLKSPGLSSLGLKSSWLKSLGLKNPGLERSWLKSLGLKGLGLKLGVEKSGVEMSCNPVQVERYYHLFLCVINESCLITTIKYLPKLLSHDDNFNSDHNI